MLFAPSVNRQEDGYEQEKKDPQRRIQGVGGDGGVAGSQDGQRAGSGIQQTGDRLIINLF